MNTPFVCPSCLVEKHQQTSYTHNAKRSDEPCKLLHIDTLEPFLMASLQGQRYMFAILDDNTTAANVAMLWKKNNACAELKGTIIKWENLTGTTVKEICSDKAKEFEKSDIDTFMKTRDIIHQKTTPYAHPQNQKAKQFIRIIEDQSQTLMAHAGLLASFLADTILMSVYFYM